MPGLAGLDFQPRLISFVGGLNTKGDKRAQNNPALDVCLNVEFDDIGGLRTRLPMGAAQGSIFGGGTIANARQLVENGDELCLFTNDTLYSWNAQQSAWVRRGTHLAVKVDEQTVFADTADQITGDRAELNGTIVYAWIESTNLYVAAIDKATGSVLMPPTIPSNNGVSGTYVHPRLVALSTKILLITSFDSGGGPALVAWALDPAAPATAPASSATTVLAAGTYNIFYDAVRIPSADSAILAIRRITTTSYTIAKVTSALAVTTSTKARTCGFAIAISCTPDGASALVARTPTVTTIFSDLVTISSLADTANVNQSIGSIAAGVAQLTAAHRSVQDSGQYRCYMFWSAAAGNVSDGPVGSNWVDTGGTIGSPAATIGTDVSVASRAFDFNGRIFVWLSYGLEEIFSSGSPAADYGQLQNAYYLYRDDGFFCAKAVRSNGGPEAALGYLPGVALTAGSTTFSWLGSFRNPKIGVGANVSGTAFTNFVGRSPQDITFTFDSNEARRCARLGATLYIAAGEILAYDGQQIVEVGFHSYPNYLLATASNAGGSVPNGAYNYKHSYRWQNAKGDRDRSAAVVSGSSTMAGAPPGRFVISPNTIGLTHKTGVYFDIWRTKVATAEPHYLVSSLDPTVVAGSNRSVLASAPGTFNDDYADTSIVLFAEQPDTGDVLEPIAPPAASIIAATDTRIFLAGIAGDPDRVWYSRLRDVGEVASFNDGLSFVVPKEGGKITGITFLEGVPVVFRERATYRCAGSGFDNTGAGQNYVPFIVSHDLGATSQEGVAIDDDGLAVKTSKGMFLLDKSFTYHYIGAGPSVYDAELVLGIEVLTKRHQIRVLTGARMLVLDTLVNQWSEWTISDGLAATMWNGTYVYLASTGARFEQTTYTGVDYGLDIETSWEKLADLHGTGIVRLAQVLGEWKSEHKLRVRMAVDYKSDGAGGWAYTYDKIWLPDQPVVGGPERVQIWPVPNRMGAVKFRLTAVATDGISAPSGAACSLTGMMLDAAVEQPFFTKLAATAQQ